jgi:nitrogen-specific signal transduction histidine kinase
VQTPLLVLDGEMRVKRATPAFCAHFRVAANAVEGELLYDLGSGQWNIPALRSLLEDVLPKNAQVTDFKVQHSFPKIGKKTMLLNARRVAPTNGEEPVIVLAITEVPA